MILHRWIYGIPHAALARANWDPASAGTPCRTHLEETERLVAMGYHHTLAHGLADLDSFGERSREHKPFVWTGIGMALGVLDDVTPWNHSRLARFLDDRPADLALLLAPGVGRALARSADRIRSPETRLRFKDPFQRQLALEQYAFQRAFYGKRGGETQPAGLRELARRAYNRGLGYGFWVRFAGNVAVLAAHLTDAPGSAVQDHWTGLGFACVHLGGVARAEVERLRAESGAAWRDLAVGAAVAALFRIDTGCATAWTEHACKSLCGRSAAAVSELARGARADSGEPSFEYWRGALRARFR